MRRGILGVEGSRIADVEKLRCKLKPIHVYPRIDVFRRRVRGRRISKVDRIGKRVVLRLDDESGLIFEPRMTGLVLVSAPPDVEYLRFRVRFTDGPIPEVSFWDRRGLGSVQLFSASEIRDRLGSQKLGPDALAITAEALRERLSGSRRAIKVALLDQKAIAGIGNLYASEILHVAGIRPQKRCAALRRIEWERVASATTEVLREAVRYEGSTLADGTYRNALNKSGGYQNHHRVYSRVGALCPRCKIAKIQRIVQAQRSTFFCPSCQK